MENRQETESDERTRDSMVRLVFCLWLAARGFALSQRQATSKGSIDIFVRFPLASSAGMSVHTTCPPARQPPRFTEKWFANSHASSMAWGRARRGSASRTNLRGSSPVPLTGLCLAAGRCCGGRHGADAQNGAAVSRAWPQPRALGGTAPVGRPSAPYPQSSDRGEQSLLRASDFGNAFRSINTYLGLS